jgi:hypothetical protein
MRRALLLLLLTTLGLAFAAPTYAQTPPEPVIADDVTIVGVEVGGLTAEQAAAVVQTAFDQRLVLRLRLRTLAVSPRTFSHARVALAVQGALAAPAHTAVPLEVVVTQWKLRRWTKALAKNFYRARKNTTVLLRKLRPYLTEPKPGRALLKYRTRRLLTAALVHHRRGPLSLPTRDIKPKVTRWNFGKAIVIRRDSKRLILYRSNGRAWMPAVRAFGVATGMAAYPTPLGHFHIATMQRNPWWYPPDAGWAADASPIPPGPGNPLGTRWMGLSVGGVGIHGTPDAASIGYSASHGCIRMRIPEAEWLFERVSVGTAVFIVGA